MLNYRGENGFSLMELLIVMTIMGLLMSIVAPLSLSAISKSEARVELQETKNWLRVLRNKAFLTQTEYKIQVARNNAILIESESVKLNKTFEHLNFEPVVIKINSFGIATPSTIMALNDEQVMSIQLR
ncbi:prepilin-type N-terminal cleavage/methylation domain-containing protein [Pseudoalteromonas sp. MMG013]|uniref:pilus assembly FimT family protein n=1 Tax=Pseudoalteromonas sp. MMG013 TaxID=2822687 RepID=UPI001B382628|nr:prepilin-type N-terminal cleavage/methylation domain-containing protein [Pseudoalteromonas sp. MMG013]MBQ4860831.1 prepilin-type N-terminal cleavage/methylation domain-containing protein [Pseudoalteromonas sp. MMG013]